MQNVFVRFENGATSEFSKEFGPFEYAQLTYDTLNVQGSDDDEPYVLAVLLHNMWNAPDDKSYSDVVIAPTSDPVS